MSALMAAPAERERLEERVLEAEVARLPRAIGAILQAAGAALASSEDRPT